MSSWRRSCRATNASLTSWDVEGTTGYDALAEIDRVLIDPSGRDTLDRVDLALYGGAAPTWNDLVHRAKRAVADGPLRSEVLRLTRQLGDRARPAEAVEADRVADGVAELLTCFPVYRSYLPIGVEHLQRAVRCAHHYRPDLDGVIAELVPVLADPDEPAAVRFQQTSGMVMAKGVEDCAFYRYNQLGTLTEVGGDPSEFSIDVAEFHRRQRRRLQDHPLSMTTLTTHDTKRSEDARARISVLAEISDDWAETFARLRKLSPPPDGPLAELIWQAAIGAWPLSRDRLSAYALKAAREAGTSTSWTTPDPRFEQAVQEMVDDAYDHPDVVEELDRIVDLVRRPGWSNSLAAKLIQLTAPGVPDVYQGTEVWDTSLVDPDNRRPIDFARRRALLAAVRGTLPPLDDTGAAKLLVTTTALRYRRDHPDLFTDYTPVHGDGAAAEHLVAFDRGGALTIATRLPVRLRRNGGWRDTVLHLDAPDRVDAITGRSVAHGTAHLADILHDYPVALLVPTATRHGRARSECSVPMPYAALTLAVARYGSLAFNSEDMRTGRRCSLDPFDLRPGRARSSEPFDAGDPIADLEAAHLQLSDVLDMLLQRVEKLLEADTAAILLMDRDGSQLIARSARGLEDEVRQGVRVPLGMGFAGQIAATRAPVVLDDIGPHTVVNPILWKHGVCSMLGAPLIADGRLLGVVHVGSLHRRHFSDDDTRHARTRSGPDRQGRERAPDVVGTIGRAHSAGAPASRSPADDRRPRLRRSLRRR